MNLEKNFNDAVALLSGSGDEIVPATLGANDQINFFVGYHQQQQELWKSRKDRETEGEAAVSADAENDD